ncbi:MAG: hypothetical protein KKE94_07855 [Gammaproteobacteria bacterium]|nr:hypothetical protein [Gammaproteobacteria bacterium]
MNCIICGSKKLKHLADDMRMRCDTVECLKCGVLCPATPWLEADERLAKMQDSSYRAGKTAGWNEANEEIKKARRTGEVMLMLPHVG